MDNSENRNKFLSWKTDWNRRDTINNEWTMMTFQGIHVNVELFVKHSHISYLRAVHWTTLLDTDSQCCKSHPNTKRIITNFREWKDSGFVTYQISNIPTKGGESKAYIENTARGAWYEMTIYIGPNVTFKSTIWNVNISQNWCRFPLLSNELFFIFIHWNFFCLISTDCNVQILIIHNFLTTCQRVLTSLLHV